MLLIHNCLEAKCGFPHNFSPSVFVNDFLAFTSRGRQLSMDNVITDETGMKQDLMAQKLHELWRREAARKSPRVLNSL